MAHPDSLWTARIKPEPVDYCSGRGVASFKVAEQAAFHHHAGRSYPRVGKAAETEGGRDEGQVFPVPILVTPVNSEGRGPMQAGLSVGFTDHSPLLPSEDVEVFLSSLDGRSTHHHHHHHHSLLNSHGGHSYSHGSVSAPSPATPYGLHHHAASQPLPPGSTLSSAPRNPHSHAMSYSMFSHQPSGSMAGMGGVHAAAPTYHPAHDSTQGPFLHAGSAPVYVPTTRAQLPAVGYMSSATNGTSQAAVSQSSSTAGMWSMGSAAAGDSSCYTSANSHQALPSRFSFPPSPPTGLQSPGGRSDASFSPPLGRPAGLSPYSAYAVGPADMSPWTNSSYQGVGLSSQQAGLTTRRPNTSFTEYCKYINFCLPYNTNHGRIKKKLRKLPHETTFNLCQDAQERTH